MGEHFRIISKTVQAVVRVIVHWKEVFYLEVHLSIKLSNSLYRSTKFASSILWSLKDHRTWSAHKIQSMEFLKKVATGQRSQRIALEHLLACGNDQWHYAAVHGTRSKLGSRDTTFFSIQGNVTVVLSVIPQEEGGRMMFLLWRPGDRFLETCESWY